ncbi:hypothetical protein C8R46DRAFT_1359338 [Mycena filopes]|nr:hypothetical protein C8R46DRAFT_1359338 [Mycena filopes]
MSASTKLSSRSGPTIRGSEPIYGIAFGAFGALLLVVFILGLARRYIRKLTARHSPRHKLTCGWVDISRNFWGTSRSSYFEHNQPGIEDIPDPRRR